jgi:hypothetical protein
VESDDEFEEGDGEGDSVFHEPISSPADSPTAEEGPHVDLSAILRPLLDSAAAFCATKHVAWVVEDDGILGLPCILEGEYSIAKHVLGTLLDAAMNVAVDATVGEHAYQSETITVRLAKEGRGMALSVLVDDTGREDAAKRLCRDAFVYHLGIESDALEEDVQSLGGDIRLVDGDTWGTEARTRRVCVCRLWLPCAFGSPPRRS